jgi:hypothetical protein
MNKARNVKWGNGRRRRLRAMSVPPGDPISLDEYSNSPRAAAPSGDGADFAVQNCLTDE